MDFRMMADGEKMERIYFNLLSNAVKYTPENGKIMVRLEAEATNFRFSVFNSGSHISPKEVDAIFERFYQIDGHQAGTGIGLALVRAFVEMHGGRSLPIVMKKERLLLFFFRRRVFLSITRRWLLFQVKKQKFLPH